jgi:VanZ family protein
MMKTNKKTWRIWTLRITLTILCLLVLAWIFSNSLQTGEQSAEQSQTVVDVVQDTAGVIAPDSSIANATGDDYATLHNSVRNFAHFAEFALLGFLLTCCYFSYTRQKQYFVIPAGLVLLTPMIDECLQTFIVARGAEISDVFLDTAGGFTGMIAALLSLAVIWIIYKKKGKI